MNHFSGFILLNLFTSFQCFVFDWICFSVNKLWWSEWTEDQMVVIGCWYCLSLPICSDLGHWACQTIVNPSNAWFSGQTLKKTDGMRTLIASQYLHSGSSITIVFLVKLAWCTEDNQGNCYRIMVGIVGLRALCRQQVGIKTRVSKISGRWCWQQQFWGVEVLGGKGYQLLRGSPRIPHMPWKGNISNKE